MVPTSINLIPEAPLADLVALAVQAESLGYRRCWVYDEGLATRDVYITMAAIAQATRHLGLGTGITNPYTRHPATTAAAIASLDELSDGRAFLGLGAGGSLTLDPLGLARSRPVETVHAVMTACRQLFAGERVTLQGPGFGLHDAHLGYPCRADIEIWLAGRGPRMLHLGGRVADGVMLDFIHKERLADYVGMIRQGAGTTRGVKVCYSTMVITDDASMKLTKPHMTYRLVDSPAEVKELIGITDAEVDTIRGALAGGLEAAAEYVRDEWVLPFVISGTPSECAAELADLVERHGLDEFLLPVLDVHHGPALIATVADVVRRS
jgi:5,10-methylenetetrahydromethanopterin reductase